VKRALVLLATALLLAAPTPSAAEEWDPPSETALTRSREHFDKGLAAYRAREYAEAIEHYRKAYDLVRLPAILFNLGQAFRLSGDREAAIEAYWEFLREAPEHELAAETREHLSELGASEEPPPRAPPEPEPQPDAIDEPAQEPDPIAPPPTVDREPSGQGSALRLAGLATATAGAAALGASAYYGLEARRLSRDLAVPCEQAPGECPAWTAEEIDDIARGERAERRAIVTGVVGGAALASGAGLYLWGRRAGQRPPLEIAVNRWSGGVSIFVAGAFR
jgi:tetratricopeptide (TPR) repeat protein